MLVTVPHAACNSAQRDCDRVSEQMALLLNADYLFVNKDVPRSQIDMNRAVARNTAFRQAIAATPARVLIDVHSFPCCVFGAAHIAIMEPYPTPQVRRLIDEYLRPMLRKQGLVGKWMQSDVIDIVINARAPVSFLLEVREDLTPTQLSAIATAINTWFYKGRSKTSLFA